MDIKDLPSDEVMSMLSQEALRQAFQSVSEQLRSFADHPVSEGLSGRDALLAAADALISTNDSVFGAKQ